MLVLTLPGSSPLARSGLAPAAPGRLPEGEVASLRPALRGLIARVLGQALAHPDVEDATQEALRRVLESAGSLRPGEPLRPWAFGVARHVALDALRSRRRSLQRHGTDEPADALDTLVDAAPDPESVAQTEQQADAVREALATLPEGQRQALLLFHGEGLSYQQIAARLSLPVGTVATWITRGRKTITDACLRAGRAP